MLSMHELSGPELGPKVRVWYSKPMARTCNTRILMLLFLLTFLFASQAPLISQTGSLYGASVSESAIFVRLLNARSDGPVQLRLGPARLLTQNPGDMTPYHPVSADLYILRYLGAAIEFIPRTGTLYSIVADDQGLTILSDQPHTDPARTQIYFYNPAVNALGALSLRTLDGQTIVIDSVAPGLSRYVLVNPLTIELALFDEDGQKRSPDLPFTMSRGESIAVLAVPSDNHEVQGFIQPASIHQP